MHWHPAEKRHSTNSSNPSQMRTLHATMGTCAFGVRLVPPSLDVPRSGCIALLRASETGKEVKAARLPCTANASDAPAAKPSALPAFDTTSGAKDRGSLPSAAPSTFKENTPSSLDAKSIENGDFLLIWGFGASLCSGDAPEAVAVHAGWGTSSAPAGD